MPRFRAKIAIIGVNPYIIPPPAALAVIFKRAGKDKGPVPVKGTLNGKPFKQTLVKYAGHWRLYLNTPMRKATRLDVGDTCTVVLDYDPGSRAEPINPALSKALARNRTAKSAFQKLAPSRQKEILRYLNRLKSPDTLARNVSVVIGHLTGKRPKLLRAVMRVP